MAVNTITKDNLDSIIAANELVFIDFWAEWCAPCKAFAPIFAEISSRHPDIFFGEVNIEKEQELAADFYVRTVPQLMVFKQGIVVCAESGTMPASALEDLIKQAKGLDLTEIKNKIAQEEKKESN